MVLEHRGLSWGRTLDPFNIMEQCFAEAWERRQTSRGWRVLQKLLPNATQPDAFVAATVVQWLGSSVGLSVHEVAKTAVRPGDSFQNNLQRVWGESQKCGRLLAYLLHPADSGVPTEPSLREYYVAHTVISWLGTPAGIRFYRRVLKTLNAEPKESANE